MEEVLQPNVTGVAALLMVTSMERSLQFYVDGLGFEVKNRWVPDGHLRWVWMELGTAALMLQEATGDTPDRLAKAGKLGNGCALYFQCRDAISIYRQAVERGVAGGEGGGESGGEGGREPQVGNFNWEVFLRDPDGYSINFSSPTDLPEETLLSQTDL